MVFLKVRLVKVQSYVEAREVVGEKEKFSCSNLIVIGLLAVSFLPSIFAFRSGHAQVHGRGEEIPEAVRNAAGREAGEL